MSQDFFLNLFTHVNFVYIEITHGHKKRCDKDEKDVVEEEQPQQNCARL